MLLPIWTPQARTRGVARSAGVVAKSKWFCWIPMNEWDGELFDPTTTPALRATPPVPGGEFGVAPSLRIHSRFTDRAYRGLLSLDGFEYDRKHVVTFQCDGFGSGIDGHLTGQRSLSFTIPLRAQAKFHDCEFVIRRSCSTRRLPG